MVGCWFCIQTVKDSNCVFVIVQLTSTRERVKDLGWGGRG